MTGTILQVSISPGGVPKRGIPAGQLAPLGFEGDGHSHPEIHGGLKQAVLLIAQEVIDDLVGQGYPVYAGALGENLTTSGLDWRQWRIGQRYRVGSQAWIELTKARGPCATLDVYNPDGLRIQNAIYDARVKGGDPASPKWGMSGFYARVVEPGVVRAGDIITLVDQVA